MRYVIIKSVGIVFAAALLILFLDSCKKFPDPGMNIEAYQPDSSRTVVSTKRKVLLINIEGLTSQALTSVNPPQISGLLANAKIGFGEDTVAFPLNSTSSWGALITGNYVTRMWDSTFYATPVDSTSTVPVPYNLTALRHMHDHSTYSNRIVAVTSWYNLLHTLLADADKKILTSDDAGTKNETVASLKTDSANLIVCNFNSVNVAGLQGGYSTANSGYVQNIQTVDGYIGEMITAMKSRSSYNKESWLTLITNTEAVDSLVTSAKSYMGLPNKISPFIIAHNKNLKPNNLSTMVPKLDIRRADAGALILYWLKIPRPLAVQNGTTWLDRFGIEFITD